MIKFFRQIRQKLLSENKMGKYLLYATGEIFLVVIGILIALSINNWNENQKLAEQRQQLISSLIEDFEYNRSIIIDDGLAQANALLNDMQLFYDLTKPDSADVTLDSLRYVAQAFFRNIIFTANLTSLNEATSNGKLSLLGNKQLLNKFSLFQQYHDAFQDYNDQSRHSYFNGSLWEIRKTVAPSVLAGNQAIAGLSIADYKKIIETPLAQVAFYNSQALAQNKKINLTNLLETTDEILSILYELKMAKK